MKSTHAGRSFVLPMPKPPLWAFSTDADDLKVPRSRSNQSRLFPTGCPSGKHYRGQRGSVLLFFPLTFLSEPDHFFSWGGGGGRIRPLFGDKMKTGPLERRRFGVKNLAEVRLQRLENQFRRDLTGLPCATWSMVPVVIRKRWLRYGS